MAPKRPFQPGDVWRLRSVGDPQVSTDGARVAYVVGEPDPVTDASATTIWVAPTDGGAPARPFSAGPHDTSPRWSPDGSRLAFLADRGGEGHGSQLYVASLDGGEPQPITAAPFGVTAVSWSPDGARLAYVARTGAWKEPGDRTAVENAGPRMVTGLRSRFDSVGWFDARRSHVFVIPVAGGPPRQVTDGDFDDTDPAWSPDGRWLAFVSDRGAGRADRDQRDVWVVGTSGRFRPRRLTRGLGTVAGPRWSPDGRSIAFAGHEHGVDNFAANVELLVVAVRPSGPPVSLSAPLDRSVAGLQRPPGDTHAWSADGTSVLFLAADGGAQRLYRASLADPDPHVVVGGDRQILAFGASAEVLAFVPVWPSAAPEVICADGDGRHERRVSDANADLRRSVRYAPVRRARHTTADGLEVDAFILSPPGPAPGVPAPTVLEIHGGPHGAHPQASMMPLYQSLAAAGYVVVLANPRGSQGYGQAFTEACVGDWGGKDFDDLMGALDALIDGGVADAARLFVGGYSYGGFMASWAVGHTDRFRGACVSAPVTDLVSMWGTTDIPYFLEAEIGGTPWEAPDAYRAHSPVTYVADMTTPVLVLHWDGDLRCPVGQGDELFAALRRQGRDVELVRYPGGFHVTRTPSQLVDYIGRHLDWFARHGGPPA
jgi:dipeptidyl aminopeptidase/acylaminoacyl peptidase